jgi:hypothetical protein
VGASDGSEVIQAVQARDRRDAEYYVPKAQGWIMRAFHQLAEIAISQHG